MTELIRADGANRPAGTAGATGNPRAADWLRRSRTATLLWLVAQLRLGYRRARDLSRGLPQAVT